MSPAFALQEAMRQALLARPQVTGLLGGGYVFDELPRGAPPSFIEFTACETRDWSTLDQQAHEHFVSLSVRSNARSRKLAQELCSEVELALDNAPLRLEGHRLVSLRLLFWSVFRTGQTFGAALRFRAATEPT